MRHLEYRVERVYRVLSTGSSIGLVPACEALGGAPAPARRLAARERMQLCLVRMPLEATIVLVHAPSEDTAPRPVVEQAGTSQHSLPAAVWPLACSLVCRRWRRNMREPLLSKTRRSPRWREGPPRPSRRPVVMRPCMLRPSTYCGTVVLQGRSRRSRCSAPRASRPLYNWSVDSPHQP